MPLVFRRLGVARRSIEASSNLATLAFGIFCLLLGWET
jgi:hypothetical protein